MKIVNKTSKMRFTNNRLTGLRADNSLLGSSRLCRVQQKTKYKKLLLCKFDLGDFGGIHGKGDQRITTLVVWVVRMVRVVGVVGVVRMVGGVRMVGVVWVVRVVRMVGAQCNILGGNQT